MLSSESSAAMVTVQSQRTSNAPTQKPTVVDFYNHNMNGVDIADQHSVYYSFQQKTWKWWCKVFFWLMEATVVNSYVLYEQSVTAAGDRPRSHLTYRRAVLEILASRICAAPPRPLGGRPSKRPRLEARPDLMNRHLHVLGKRDHPVDCVVCSLRAKGTRRRTLYFCKSCTNTPSLHPDICFERYHTLFNYKL